MNDIKVFGHQAPDTDATSSAIVWAWFLTHHRNVKATAYVLGQPNTEADFVLKKWGFETPKILKEISKDDTVAIVDTNNPDELFTNINEAEIHSIIDHHRLAGGLKTSSPLEIIIQPYASTMTVMFNVMNIKAEDLPREIAGLMLSGIVSDTLEFRSPTTTPTDEKLAKDLAKALEINITDYANEMFDAKSNISHFTDSELLRLDSKIVEIKGKNIRIAVLETTNPTMVLDRKESLVTSIKQVCKEDNVELVLLFVIDILKQEATLLTYNNNIKELAAEAFDVTTDSDIVILPGIVSRKKQIIPALSRS